MSSNLPDGVTDAHPEFNSPAESVITVQCGHDEALVIPSFAINAELNEIRDYIGRQVRARQNGSEVLLGISGRLGRLLERITSLEQEREYDCTLNPALELDLPESECAQWVCPVCGNDNETDTLPEDRDPDEAWDSRYDD